MVTEPAGLPANAPYVPPYPPRPEQGMPILQQLRLVQSNSVAIWTKASFERDMAKTKLWRRDLFVCNTPESIRYTLIERHENFDRRGPQFRVPLVPLLGDGLVVSGGALWRERRRLVAPVTHPSRMPDFAPIITNAAAELREAWRRRASGAVIDVAAEMSALSAEIIARTIFGRALGPEAAAEVVSTVTEYLARTDTFDLLSLFGLPDWLPRLSQWRTRDAVRRLHRVVDGLIADILDGSRQAEPSMVRSMGQAALEHTNRAMDRRGFRNEAVTLFMTGHETTANALSWALFLLSQDQTSAERLAAETATVLGGRAATLADLPHLPFTRAVLDETLRLYPTIPLILREARAADRIGGRDVRKGSIILVAPWLLHRKPQLWDQPDAFIPDRFMPGAPKPARFSYIPFGVGPRVCIGQSFGLTEAVICLATLAGSFRFALEPGTQIMPVGRITLRPGESLPMRITERG